MRSRADWLHLLVPLALALAAQAARSQGEAWRRGFHVPDLDESVSGLTSFETAAGTFLIAVGGFGSAGPHIVNHVAAWDGSQWSPLGSGIDSAIAHPLCAASFDDGSGPALYVGGLFAGAGGVPAANLARWDGAVWSALGSGVDKHVLTLAGFDYGSGPALFAGGRFTSAGGQPAGHIARWDGAGWSALGSGVDGEVNALAVYDEGQGPALFVAGSFANAGGVLAPGIARWDGSTWSALAPSLLCGIGALEVYDDGMGPALYAAGVFAPPAGAPRHGVARWKQGAWKYASDLGIYANPLASATFDAGRGAGPELFFAGDFFTGGGVWQPLGTLPYVVAGSYPGDPSSIRALTSVDLGSGPLLVTGGGFGGIQSFAPYQPMVPARHVAAWDGLHWSRLGSFGQGLDAGVQQLAVLPGVGGAADSVAALGWFTLAGDLPVRGAALWDGDDWEPLADDTANMHALIADPVLPGAFHAAVGSQVRYWNTTSWSPLEGLDGGVIDFAYFDFGTGPQLVAAGAVSLPGAPSGQALARWDGAAWHHLGLRGSAVALASWTPSVGGQPRLVAAGDFYEPLVALGVVMLEGGTWSPLGGSLDNGTPSALATLAGASGPQLYLGGQFDGIAGVPAHAIARWDGSSWSPLGAGLAGRVNALAVREVGTIQELIVAGDFTHAGELRAANIARWSGTSWSSLGAGQGNGTNVPIDALATVGTSVYAGGWFSQAGGLPSSSFACWGP